MNLILWVLGPHLWNRERNIRGLNHRRLLCSTRHLLVGTIRVSFSFVLIIIDLNGIHEVILRRHGFHWAHGTIDRLLIIWSSLESP
jgi:hypothetical protein